MSRSRPRKLIGNYSAVARKRATEISETEAIEDTIGYRLAIGFKPFINPACPEHIEIVKDMAKSINRACVPLIDRVSQLLTAIDYDKLTTFQLEVIKGLEAELSRLK